MRNCSLERSHLKQHVYDIYFFSFCLQNGQMFVFTGLLTAVSDIHQLSFILGHEIAHAVLGHAVSALRFFKKNPLF